MKKNLFFLTIKYENDLLQFIGLLEREGEPNQPGAMQIGSHWSRLYYHNWIHTVVNNVVH